jgi:xanthine/uracil permease
VRFLRAIVETAIIFNPQRIFTITGLIMILVSLILALFLAQRYFNSPLTRDEIIYRLLIIGLLLNTGTLLLGLGYISQRFLELIHYRKPEPKRKSGFTENLFLNHGLLLGMLILTGATYVFIDIFSNFMNSSQAVSSWPSLVVGTFMFLLGFQLISFGVMGIIFGAVNSYLGEGK